MQSDRDALLAGIVADPDADLPRLVFADWLEETGHPANCARAEYIRLAIDQPGDARLGELRAMFRDEWDAAVIAHPEMSAAMVAYSRGFVNRITAPIDSLVDCLSLSHAAAPVEHVAGTWPDRFEGLAVTGYLFIGEARPQWRLRSLTLDGVRDTESVLIYLLQTCYPDRLQSVSLSGCDFDDRHLVGVLSEVRPVLAESRVVELNLSGNPLTDRAAHVLAAADWPPTLRRLLIDRTRITNAGREVLFRRFGFEELRPRLALG